MYEYQKVKRKIKKLYMYGATIAFVACTSPFVSYRSAQALVDSTNENTAGIEASDDSTNENTAEIEASDESTNENTAEIEASDDSTNENTAGIEASDDSTNENTAGIEASEDSTNENTAEIEASDDSTNENTAEIEASDDSTNENTAEIEASDDSTNENTAEDDLDIYQAVLQDDFDLNNFLDKLLQDKTLDEKIISLQGINIDKVIDSLIKNRKGESILPFIEAYGELRNDLITQRDQIMYENEDDIYQAVLQDDFDFNQFLDKGFQNKTLDEQIDYFNAIDANIIKGYLGGDNEKQQQFLEAYNNIRNDLSYELYEQYLGEIAEDKAYNDLFRAMLQGGRDFYLPNFLEKVFQNKTFEEQKDYFNALDVDLAVDFDKIDEFLRAAESYQLFDGIGYWRLRNNLDVERNNLRVERGKSGDDIYKAYLYDTLYKALQNKTLDEQIKYLKPITVNPLSEYNATTASINNFYNMGLAEGEVYSKIFKILFLEGVYENTAEDSIYRAVLKDIYQDNFDITQFLDKVLQNKTLDEQIKYFKAIDQSIVNYMAQSYTYDGYSGSYFWHDLTFFYNNLDMRVSAERVSAEDNIYLAALQDNFDLTQFLKKVLQNKTLDEKIEYIKEKDFGFIELINKNKKVDLDDQRFKSIFYASHEGDYLTVIYKFLNFDDDGVYALHFKGGKGQEEFDSRMEWESIVYPEDYWTVDTVEKSWEEIASAFAKGRMAPLESTLSNFRYFSNGPYINESFHGWYLNEDYDAFNSMIYDSISDLKALYSGTNIHPVDIYFSDTDMLTQVGWSGPLWSSPFWGVFITTSDGKVYRSTLQYNTPVGFHLYTEYNMIDKGGEEGSSNEVPPGGETGEGSSNEVQPGGETGEGSSNEVQPGGETGEGSSNEVPPGGETGEGSSNEVQPGGETGEGSSNEVPPGGETGEGSSNENPAGDEIGEEPATENPAGDEIGEEPTNENPTGDEIGEEATNENPAGDEIGEEPATENPAGDETGEEPTNENPVGDETGEEPANENPVGDETGEEPANENPAGDEIGEEPTNENPAGDETGEDPTNENPAGDETNEDPTNENPTGDESSEDSPNDNKTIKRFEDSPFGRRRFDINEDYVTVEDEDEHVSSYFEISVSGD
ncbi:hypothetical protein [Lysinibacillus sp. Bpr_S20]|uniref:hypothetical protein n=1 Tax=Lysinibacillus sp. Bpr_S20 TaxID=2933964 RepID=UPI002012AE82|nr:hypothetical protein [Lysinibacillus sp. Bpr_S20]MCL1701305.1 hypothetical protein [Lysinibacillus sp. Bpr_S20]